MPHPFARFYPATWSMACRKGTFILNKGPDLFVGKLTGETNHAGSGRTVFDDPKNFALRAMAPEAMMLKVAGRGIELHGRRPIAGPL